VSPIALEFPQKAETQGHTEVQEEMFCAIFSHNLKEMHKSAELYLRVFV
jgi:hypothetical protein